MTRSTTNKPIVLFCLAVIGTLLCQDAEAFSVMKGTSVANPMTSALYMSEEAPEQPEEQEAEEEGPPEDPEVTALKESIAELEATLADKKSKLQYELEQCEEYSKSGYARKVADMENMKRVRSNIASTSKASATASVLKEFLPVYDTLNQLKETYAEDEFGRKFSELNLEQTFATLGVTSFDVQPGDAVNNFRMKVLESEYSNDCDKDTVLKMVAPGMELEGNVVRAALCVSSLGSEADAAAAESEEEATEEGPSE